MSQSTPENTLTHEQVRKTVSAGLEEEIRRLRNQHSGKRAIEIVFFAALFLIGAAMIWTGVQGNGSLAEWTFIIAGTIISALALNTIVLFLHEGMHYTLFPRKWVNDTISVLLGACVLMSYTAYQVMHIRHHDFLGDPRDPDDYHNYTKSPVIIWLLHFMRLLLGSFLYIFLIPIFAWRYGSSGDRRRIVSEYLFLAIVYTVLFQLLPLSMLAWCWLLPLVIVGYMVNIRGFTQHGMTDAHDPYLASRSIHPNRVVSFLLLNENLHLEHHLFPEIPSYHLPQLNRLIGQRLPRKVVGKSYLGFMSSFIRQVLRLDESTIGLQVSDSSRENDSRPDPGNSA